MPIKNIDQPKIIKIDDTLRLRCFDNKYDFVWEWYQDLELVKLVDGQNATLYTYNKLKNSIKRFIFEIKLLPLESE